MHKAYIQYGAGKFAIAGWVFRRSLTTVGDNLIFCQVFDPPACAGQTKRRGATIFGYHVKNPSAYGAIEFDDRQRVLSIDEKPRQQKSHYASVQSIQGFKIAILEKLSSVAAGFLLTNLSKISTDLTRMFMRNIWLMCLPIPASRI